MLLQLCSVTHALQCKISGNVQISQAYLTANPLCKQVMDLLSHVHSLASTGERDWPVLECLGYVTHCFRKNLL